MPYWVSRDCGVCCAPECVSVTRLITHIKCHPSLTQRRRVVSRAVTSSSGSLSRYCVLCVSVCVCMSVSTGLSCSSHGGSAREPPHREPESAAAALLLRGIPGEKRSEREGERPLWHVKHFILSYHRAQRHMRRMAHASRAYCVDMGEVWWISCLNIISLPSHYSDVDYAF